MNDIIRPIARRDYRCVISLLESTNNPLPLDETTHPKVITPEKIKIYRQQYYDITRNSYKRHSTPSFVVKLLHAIMSYFMTYNTYCRNDEFSSNV